MLYATYICSIGLGSATVDTLGQVSRFLILLSRFLFCKKSDKVSAVQKQSGLEGSQKKDRAAMCSGCRLD